MSNNMNDEQIEKIAQAIATKMAQPAGKQLLGCGDASSTSNYSNCTGAQGNFGCSTYECGGAGNFRCGAAGSNEFRCTSTFRCYTNFTCNNFRCDGTYNP